MRKVVKIVIQLEVPEDAEVNVTTEAETIGDVECDGSQRAAEHVERATRVQERVVAGKPKEISVERLWKLLGPEVDDDNRHQLI